MTQTNSTTKSIITYLNLNGFVVWRNNNGSVYSKKRGCFLKNPNHKLGIGDIIGFRKSDGKYIEVEVKTGNDKLSQDQINHINELKAGNCISIVAKTFYDAKKQIDEYFK